MPSLFILGNDFDRAHDLKTSYWHFKEWLMTYGRFDVIAELQSLFPVQQDGKDNVPESVSVSARI